MSRFELFIQWCLVAALVACLGLLISALQACATYRPDPPWACKSKYWKCPDNRLRTVPEYEFKLD